MSNLNVNEYGQVLRVNFGLDVSSASSYNFIIEPKVGEKVEKSTATLGTANVTVGDETYTANQYIEYTTASGDLDQAGQWRIKGEATMSGSIKVISNYKSITVNP